MLSIYNNLSAGIQNVTGAYVRNNYACLQARRLLTTRLYGKAAAYHCNQLYHMQARFLCDVIEAVTSYHHLQ